MPLSRPVSAHYSRRDSGSKSGRIVNSTPCGASLNWDGSALSVNLGYVIGTGRIHQRKAKAALKRKNCRSQLELYTGYGRWCGEGSNSNFPFVKSMESDEDESRLLMMAQSPGPNQTEKVSLLDRLRSNPLMSFFKGSRNAFKLDELGVEIAVIALPALVALAADPLASLVDTAFIGQIGPVELGAVGVSIQVFNLVSKTFNLPLLNVTTSFVAEDEAAVKDSRSSVLEPMIDSRELSLVEDDVRDELLQTVDGQATGHSRPLLPSVSSALVIGTGLGVIEALVMALGAGPILTVMGVGLESSMRRPATQYLALRAIGAPAVVVALAVQGVFRGFKDTKTPLYASLVGNTINIVLDPILMFSLSLGVSGAAIATVISQYVIALILLLILNQRVIILPPNLHDLRLDRFLKSGTLLLGRTLAILLSMTLATAMAARQGAIPMAAHQVCVQVWLAASLLSDSLALAGQAIIASAFAKQDYGQVKIVMFRILQMGLSFGVMIGVVLGIGAGWFPRLFTSDADVLKIMTVIIPFVVVTQPINALAFVFDGVHYGVSDFGYAALSMIILVVPACLVLLFATPIWGLSGVWVGLSLIMILRTLAGFLRVGSCTGPWKFFLNKVSEPDFDIED